MKLLPVLMSMLLLVGCGSFSSVGATQGSGKIAFYNYDYDKVWGAALSALQTSQLKLVATDKEEGKIIAKGASAASSGDNVTVFVSAVDKESTTVEVIFNREKDARQKAVDWNDRILTEIRETLK